MQNQQDDEALPMRLSPQNHPNRLSCALLLALLLEVSLTTAGFSAEARKADAAQRSSDSSVSLVAGELQTLATDLKFAEGPVWIQAGYLLFSDIDGSTIYKWEPEKPLSVYKRPSGKSNGLTLDRQGRLIACETENRRVVRYNDDGTTQTMADKYEGSPLNAPNDVVVDSAGRIFFTDPVGFGQPGTSHVYRVDTDGSLHQVTPAGDTPNGIAFSPNEKFLYVSDWWKGEIKQYDVDAEGNLSNGRVLCQTPSPDGFKVDTQGRIYTSSGNKVRIFGSSGSFIEEISVPSVASNCAFGGSDLRTLFITGYGDNRGYLYSIRLKDPGLAPGQRTSTNSALLGLR